MTARKFHKIQNFQLQKGMTIPEAELGYVTFGNLSDDKSNLILYPNSFAFTDEDTRWLIGPGRILDSDKYFIVIPNMFGNGVSSSPGNLAEPFGPGRFPSFTHLDNIQAQHKLLTEVFGIEKIALIYGWSMGAQQALHWAALYPDQVERVCAICGTARTTTHNKVFLEGVRAALTTDPAFNNGAFYDRPVKGLRAVGRIYAGWALSQKFYKEKTYLQAGYTSLEDFLVRFWESNFLKRDANNLLSMIDTWMASDISANEIYNHDLPAALSAIRAQTVMIASNTDLYFTPEDIRDNASGISDCTFYELDTLWGHRAGNPTHNSQDEEYIKNRVAELLAG